MNEKDGQILKDSAIVIADNIASIIPGLSIAWNLSKALYGAGLKLREQRVLEWVEMVRDNPNVFYEQILSSENFQDTFVYSFEKYILERNETKRLIIKSIFIGYSQSKDFEQFEIERMTNFLSIISYKGLELLKLLKDIPEVRGKNLSELFLEYLVSDSSSNPEKYKLEPGSNVREIWADAETDLISVGILRTYNIPRLGGTNYHDYDFTNTGREFIKYISN
ncbi:MAG: hypothetical protein RI996_408 [Candidatus Parcubacteria bacterium]|jgi:hypothetical protein